MIDAALDAILIAPRLTSVPPLTPDAPDAREQLINELSKAPYREAQPSWFDTISQEIWRWFQSLFSSDANIGSNWISLLAVVALVTLIVIAIVKWGVPRLNRRSSGARSIFGERDTRTAAQMRAAATLAAKQNNWSLAIAEQFRALATGLAERTIVSVSPGTTATDFARVAAGALPPEAEAFAAASAIFDGVRYLDHSGSEAEYLLVLQLDERAQSAKATHLQPAGSLTSPLSRGDGGNS